MARRSSDEKKLQRDNRSRRRKRSRRKELAAAWTVLAVLIVLVVGGAVGGGLLFRRWSDRKVDTEPREQSREVVPETLAQGEPSADDRAPEARVQEILDSMTLEQKAAQLFFVTPEQLTGYTLVTAAGEATKAAYEGYPVGGLIYFKENLQSPDQVKEMMKNMKTISRAVSAVPVFLGVDEEGGTVSRIGNQKAFHIAKVPDMAAIGATEDVKEGYEAGKYIGAYLADLGFNLDFAPVADVLTNPANTLMEKRAFSKDSQTAADFSSAFLRGLEEQGVSGVLKHYPGQGAVSGDTHEGFAYTDKTLDQLMESELIPFQTGIGEGADIIMAAHISATSVTGDNTPSSLSKVMITDVLRGKLGYDGLVVTDALNMGAVADHYTSDVASVMAIQAGVDLLLMPKDFKAAYEGIIKAVKDGTITEERINQSVLRILKLKFEKLQ